MGRLVTEAGWIRQSAIATRGVAGGAVTGERRITERDQGVYHYTIGRYAEPVLRVAPGTRIVVETKDAFEGKIKTERHRPSELIEMPFTNPQNGPIVVEGARKGDVLAVYVESIVPRGPQPRGTTCFLPEFGLLVGTDYTATLNEPLPETVRKVNVDESGIRWSPKITLPYAPFIGTIGVAPEIDSISSLWPGKHGGNMDLPDAAPGNVIYLPVRADGGYLYLGDCHAAQGDGEICGVAIEIAAEVSIVVDLIRDWRLQWPRIESAEWIMSVGSVRPLEDAVRIAYRDLIFWMERDFGFDRLEAYMLLTHCGRLRVGNVVDPNYTVGASISRSYLPTA